MRTFHLTVALVASALVTLQGSQDLPRLTSSSGGVVKELEQLMQQRKLEAIAARDPKEENRYVAALVYPNSQIMAISGIYSVPVLLNERLLRRDDRDAYVELNRAAERNGRLFIQDLGADGIHAAPSEDGRVDVVFIEVDTRVMFDGNWKDQKVSQEEYGKRYKDVDARYAHLLQVLVQELKTRSAPIAEAGLKACATYHRGGRQAPPRACRSLPVRPKLGSCLSGEALR